ncbi:unnamed protein product [Rotaria sordida]|uniref:Uncharacterized protein n=1 Tax=Rotaria sordida TaxID=392033 RepID=A0A814DYJ6_9BILA|nr:unnamed protein product [Rotaria sordida]CAF1119735.1 unnamed protein product [Rotaria sordida]
MNILIGYLFLLLQIKTIESINMKNNNQLRNQTRNEKKNILFNIETSNDIYDSSLSHESSRICMPLYSCSSNVNGSVCVILVAVFILIICLRYHCYEYCHVKKQLDQLSLQKSRLYVPNNFPVQHWNSFV